MLDGKVGELGRSAALLVVDMQRGFDNPAWGPRNNPTLEANVARLIAAWRWVGAPVVHVHHDSPDPAGRFPSGGPGHAPKPEAEPATGEAVYRKRVNSAFIGTGLEADLRRLGIDTLVIVGMTTNHCVSTTARMAGNLDFRTLVVGDATAAFDRLGMEGRRWPAEAVHDAALSDLRDEFAQIVGTAAVLEALTQREHAAA